VEIIVPLFSTSVLDGGEWSASLILLNIYLLLLINMQNYLSC
jgi:hypothetical protein